MDTANNGYDVAQQVAQQLRHGFFLVAVVLIALFLTNINPHAPTQSQRKDKADAERRSKRWGVRSPATTSDNLFYTDPLDGYVRIARDAVIEAGCVDIDGILVLDYNLRIGTRATLTASDIYFGDNVLTAKLFARNIVHDTPYGRAKAYPPLPTLDPSGQLSDPHAGLAFPVSNTLRFEELVNGGGTVVLRFDNS